MPTETKPADAKPAASKGFLAPCLKCGENNCSLDLDDLGTVHCYGCEEQFKLDDVRKLVDGWRPALAWIDSAPTRDDAP